MVRVEKAIDREYVYAGTQWGSFILDCSNIKLKDMKMKSQEHLHCFVMTFYNMMIVL